MPARPEPYDAPAITTFATELEAWRTAAGLTKTALAQALGCTDAYVGQVELCKNLPSQEFAQDLDTYFKTNGLFHRLWKRIEETRHLSTLPPGFPQYLAYEANAETIRNVSPTLGDCTVFGVTPDHGVTHDNRNEHGGCGGRVRQADHGRGRAGA
ncbi:helix-turn-helix domain-containing protein, partial [Actinomadura rugatobispora]